MEVESWAIWEIQDLMWRNRAGRGQALRRSVGGGEVEVDRYRRSRYTYGLLPTRSQVTGQRKAGRIRIKCSLSDWGAGKSAAAGPDVIPKRTWTAGPNNKNNEQPTSVARWSSILLLPPDLWAFGMGICICTGTVHDGLAGGRLAPCTLRPAPSSLRISQLTRPACAGNSGQRGKWKCRWNRTSCPAGAGRALRNISAATSRGRPPGNDAGSGPRQNAPRWTKVDKVDRRWAGRSPGRAGGTRAFWGVYHSTQAGTQAEGQKKKSRQS